MQTLQDQLDAWAAGFTKRAEVASTVAAIAAGAACLSKLIAGGPITGALGAVVGGNVDGDAQKLVDVRANEIFLDSLRGTGVAVVGSEESPEPVPLNEAGSLAVAIDPLDGSSNIDTNLSVGTIFAILPMAPAATAEGLHAAFLQPGNRQLAAGFVIYGPMTTLVLTLRAGVQVFTFDRDTGSFVLTGSGVTIAAGKREYAINASNYRHWDAAVRAYVDDCVAGADGPREAEFNMRWTASLVAEAYRILARGGVFLYPRDARPGYQQGRLRLVYEANPIALVMEEAGGAATEGEHRILDIEPTALHQRVPLVFGSRDKVERVGAYHNGTVLQGERSPLFGRRGLFRA